MDISVIIPVFNAEKYLERTIKALLAQTQKEMEFIFINDGSTDGSWKKLVDLIPIVPNIKVIDKANGGVSSARNAGLKVATGKYIGFMDSDDSIKPEMYEVLYQRAIKDNADVVCCGHIEKKGDLERLHYFGKDMILDQKEAMRHLILNYVIGMSACTKLFRASLLQGIFFDETHHINEDRFFVYEAFKKASRIAVISEALYIYYQNEGSATRLGFSQKNLDWLYFSETIYSDVCRNFLDLEQESYADVIKSAFFILILYYSGGIKEKAIHQLLVNKIKKADLERLNGYVGKKLIFQMYMVKYMEPLFHIIKNIAIRKQV